MLKMEPTQCSETSAFNTQTPGKYPEDNSSLLQHGESLKSRNIYVTDTKFYINPSSGSRADASGQTDGHDEGI
jgi:hypothetical protein